MHVRIDQSRHHDEIISNIHCRAFRRRSLERAKGNDPTVADVNRSRPRRMRRDNAATAYDKVR
jgi:hypothetical protein